MNAVLAIGLSGVLGFTAAAIGTTAAGWSMLALLWFGSRSMGRSAMPDARLIRGFPRILAASGAMALALWLAANMMAPWFHLPGLRYGALAILVIGGMGVYTIAIFAFGAIDAGDLKRAIRR